MPDPVIPLHAIPLPTLLIDRDGILIDLTNRAAAWFGVTRDGVLGRRFPDEVVTNGEAEDWSRAIATARTTPVERLFAPGIRGAGRESTWQLWPAGEGCVCAVLDPDAAQAPPPPEATLGVVSGDAVRSAFMAYLDQHDDQLCLMEVVDGRRLIHRAHNVMYGNSVLSGFGINPDSLIGRDVEEALRERMGHDKENLARAMVLHREAIASGQSHRWSARFPHKGGITHMEMALIPVQHGGQVSHLIWIGRNVTARARSESALSLQRRLLTEVMALTSAEAVLVLAPDWRRHLRVVSANQGCRCFDAGDPATWTDRLLTELLPNLDRLTTLAGACLHDGMHRQVHLESPAITLAITALRSDTGTVEQVLVVGTVGNG